MEFKKKISFVRGWLLALGLCGAAQAQIIQPGVVTPGVSTPGVVTPGVALDSAQSGNARLVVPRADTLLIKSPRHKLSPRKATLLSLALPGLGQIYNRSYWKLPIIYGGFGALGYFVVTNRQLYQEYSDAYLVKLRNPNAVVPVDIYADLRSPASYKSGRDFYRRNYELSIILTVALWALNMVDANVDAHMKTFDLSDDISFRIRPGAAAPGAAAPGAAAPGTAPVGIPTMGLGGAPLAGLTCTFTLK